MVLRGWRLFGVAGIISVYLVGILLLSFMSLSSPPQRHPQYRGGRYDFDMLRHHEVNMVAKRQPLQWCRPMRYLGETDAQAAAAVAAAMWPQQRPMQTFAGHFVRLHSRMSQKNTAQLIENMHPAARANNKAARPPNSSGDNDNNDDEDVSSDKRPSARQHHRTSRRQPSVPDAEAHAGKSTSAALSAPTVATVVAAAAAAADAGDTTDRKSKQSVAVVNGGARRGGDAAANNVSKAPKRNHRRANQKEIKQLSDSTERNLIALASFPGSGNTWLRYLLQQATGIYTGSVYKDFGLLKSGFPAENVFNSSVLVVKTHEWGQKSYEHFAKAILLVRDPDKAILAEFNRQSGGHVGFAAPDRYKRTKGRYWQQFVANKLSSWEEMNTHWARNYTGALHIVYYDDLMADVEGSLRTILQFIQYPFNEDQLACAVARKEGIYRRKKRIMTFDPYTTDMRVKLEERKRHVYSVLGRYKF